MRVIFLLGFFDKVAYAHQYQSSRVFYDKKYFEYCLLNLGKNLYSLKIIEDG